MEPSAPGWYPDPYRRHERRYWSGIRWSRHVDDAGARAEDPIDTGPTATVPIEPRPAPTPTAGPQPPTQAVGSSHGVAGTPTGGAGDVDHGGYCIGGAGSPTPTTGDSGRHGVGDHTTGEHWARRAGGHGAADRVTAEQWPSPRRTYGAGAGAPTWRGRQGYVVIAGVVTILLVAAAGVAVVLNRDGNGAAAGGSQRDPVFVAVRKSWNHRAGGAISGEQSRCMANAVIDTAGRDRLIKGGVTKGADPLMTLDPANKDTVIKKSLDCLDDQSLVAFMSANWRDQDTGKSMAMGPCVFRRWLIVLGRDRMVYLVSSFAAVDPPPLDKTLNPTEFKLATRVLNDCGTR